MKAHLLTAMFGLTGLGASGQMFLPFTPPRQLPPMHQPPAPVFEPRPAQERRVLPSLEAAAPARPGDRMMIVKPAEPARVTVPGLVLVWKGRYEAPWQQGPGFRFRLVFLDPPGATWWSGGRFFLSMREDVIQAHESKAPSPFRGSYPAYYNEEDVRVEVEVVAQRRLGGLVFDARQQGVDHDGVESGPVMRAGFLAVFPPLEAGRKATRAGSFKMTNTGTDRVNFQQTRVTVADAKGNILLEVRRAAVIDPPAR